MTIEQETVFKAIEEFQKAHRNDKRGFVPKLFVEHMEPVFRKLHYRDMMNAERQSRVLVMRDDAAGDFVLHSPFMKEVRRIYADSHITLMYSPRNVDLAKCCPYADGFEMNPQHSDSNAFWDVFMVLAKLAMETILPHHFDLAFSTRLGLRNTDVLLMYMGGVKHRVCFTQNRPDGQGHIVSIGWDDMISTPIPITEIKQNDVDRNLFVLEYMFHVPVKNRELEVWCLGSEVERAAKEVAPLKSRPDIKRLFAVVPGASGKYKEWPLENYVQAFNEILKHEPDIGFVILGGKDDAPTAQKLYEAFADRSIMLAGKLNFRESGAAIGQCDLYFGNDTGLMHLAAGQHKPVLAIYCYPLDLGITTMSVPLRFSPYHVPAAMILPQHPKTPECNQKFGYGCARRDEHCCISQITVAHVLKGYNYLKKAIRENSRVPVIVKA